VNTSLQTRANLILLLTSVIWGFAFVAQRSGMQFVGPFTFNAVRFAIGGVLLIPLALYLDRQRRLESLPIVPVRNRALLGGGVLAGVFLFGGASLQQAGLVYTTAGKAGFITGLYVVLVPIIGLAFGQRTAAGTWVGALLAVVGLYLLSVQGDFTIQLGDTLVLLGAFLWAGHVLLLGHLSPGTDPIKLACIQFFACAAFSLAAALFVETITTRGLQQALLPILYAGVMSVGVGYTLQVVGQRYARPSHAAIILSLESVFAVVGGWLLLGEQLGVRGLAGCALMLAGILISQIYGQGEVVIDGAAA
jgi:drug/metabolite transporter (DMT)-like permease